MHRAKIFRFMDQLEKKYNESLYGTESRNLHEDDYDDWAEAADNQLPSIRTREQVRSALRRINPVRWHQCQGDYRWMQKQMKKLGLNPEDARYIFD